MIKKTQIAKTSTRTVKRAALAFAAFACLTAAVGLGQGCTQNKGGSGTSGTSGATPADNSAKSDSASGSTVQIKGFKFQPATLEVKPGTTVTWKNGDDTPHTVWSGTPDAPQDGPLKATVKDGVRATFTHTFNDPGEYPYYCNFHHEMTGKVVVK